MATRIRNEGLDTMLRPTVTRLLLLFAGGLLPGTAVGQDAVPTMAEIVAAARQRQQAVQSGKFEWNVTRWTKKGGNSVSNVQMAIQGAQPNPPQETETSLQRSLTFSADKNRYDSFGPDLNIPTPFRLIATWDGEQTNQFQDANAILSGSIHSKPWFQYLDTFEPISWTFRMLDPLWARLDLQKFTVRHDFEEQNGEVCVVVELLSGRPDQPLLKRLWLDQGRDYLVSRFERGNGVTVFTRIDIEYEDLPQGISVPVRWTKIKGDVNDPVSIDECIVSAHELNTPVPPDAFRLVFPENTWVEEEGVKEPYLVRGDGVRRAITTAELKRGAKYEDIVSTPSGKAKLPRLNEEFPIAWFWIVQAIAGVAIVVAWMWVRRTKLRA